MRAIQMTHNMFQEGLYHVFFKEKPSRATAPQCNTPEQLREARMAHWFGTVVNSRLLVTGVVQIVSAVATVLSTVSYACMDFGCAVSVATPVWCGMLYLATGSFAIEVQRKPKKVKVTTLMGLNIFSLLLGLCAMITYGLQMATEPKKLNREQKIGVYVAKGSSILFTVQSLVASLYTLFLIWQGVSRYTMNYRSTYSRVPQDMEENSDNVLDTGEFSL
ncbi:transmembrane protein 253 [Lepisosteus oculatus]|uniref:Si:dkey-30c15.13 n=1 Tax=Lepisosteus oculatus TaxID=7918 RepID=W5M437_LEPOC|nr:PREDICTED: transmembrane protein 253 [Lepisosteus oculatus]